MALPSERLVTEAALTKNRFISGSGVPNGVVTATPGSIYTDTARTWDVMAWLKVAGTGNTGWDVLRAAPVTRSVISLNSTPLESGDVRYTRSEAGITLIISGLKPTASGTMNLFTGGVLASIAPPNGSSVDFRLGNANTTATRRAKFDQYGALTVYDVGTTELLFGTVHYNSGRPWVAPLGTVVTS